MKRQRIGLSPWTRGAIIAALAVLSVVLIAATSHLRSVAESPYPMEVQPRYSEAVTLGGDLPLAGAIDRSLPVTLTVKRGATLAGLLQELGLDAGEAHHASQVATRYLDPRSLRAGARIEAYVDPDTENLRSVVFPVDETGEVALVKRSDGWHSEWQKYHSETRTRVVAGTLEGSLELSVRRAGGAPMAAYRLADVFQWDLDFNRDLRTGDHFRILYEEVWVNGGFQRVGNVLAAVYESRGQELEAYRFEDVGYYDADNRPLRKQFLRSPLAFSRVTSRFSNRRFHPVLKVYRPHHGVDYGAPTGTPVRVTASGTVVSAAWDRGGGRTVKVRHPNGYLTAYLHLSGFAKGMRSGARVTQGDVIGYVGSTGLATGPHLDYRVQKAGRWMDPLSLKSEPAPGLEPAEQRRFENVLDEYRRQLETVEPSAADAVVAAGP